MLAYLDHKLMPYWYISIVSLYHIFFLVYTVGNPVPWTALERWILRSTPECLLCFCLRSQDSSKTPYRLPPNATGEGRPKLFTPLDGGFHGIFADSGSQTCVPSLGGMSALHSAHLNGVSLYHITCKGDILCSRFLQIIYLKCYHSTKTSSTK